MSLEECGKNLESPRITRHGATKFNSTWGTTETVNIFLKTAILRAKQLSSVLFSIYWSDTRGDGFQDDIWLSIFQL